MCVCCEMECGCSWASDRSYGHVNCCYLSSGRAASFGHLDCLIKIRQKGKTWDWDTTIHAVRHGDVNILRYLYENGAPWDRRTCEEAAKFGKLECLKYAHENGCRWNRITTDAAAAAGHVDCLKYARENGCRWYSTVYEHAFRNHHMNCIKYAFENNCPVDTVKPAVMAAGWMEGLEYAFNVMKCRPSLEVCFRAAQRNLECLKYAREKGCSWDATVTLAAAASSANNCFRYALEEKCPFDYDECYKMAKSKNNLELLAMLKRTLQ